MKYMLLCLLALSIGAAEQTADVVSYQPTSISFAATNSVADVNSGALPFGNNNGDYFSFVTDAGGVFYAAFFTGMYNLVSTEAYIQVADVVGGTASISGTDIVFKPSGHGPGSVTLKFMARIYMGGPTGTVGAEVGTRRTLAINVLNTAPSVTCKTPLAVRIGEKLTLSASATDPDGDSTTITYDGDSSPVKTFSAAGVYTVNVTATDVLGAQSTRPVTVVVNSADGRSPTARFTTSDVVGFVGQPIGFDAFFSTDPQNQIVGYTWDFGDGSPKGSGQAISKIYSAVGTYDVTLAITDADGITAKTVRTIEVLPADQLGLFNSEFSYTVRFNRAKEATDTLILTATVNTGAEPVLKAGTVIALEITGQRFEASLDNRLRAKVGNTSFAVKSGLRRQAAGQADVSVRITKATLGLGFNQAGAVDDGDHLVTVDIPVRVEIGSLVFEVPVESDFHFSASGVKATGKGAF